MRVEKIAYWGASLFAILVK